MVCRKSEAFSGVESSSLIPVMSSAAYWSAAWEMSLGGQAVSAGVSVVIAVIAPWVLSPDTEEGIHAVLVFIVSWSVVAMFPQGQELASPFGA